ncbi:hypothetical protein [Nocardia sp. NPDC057227]|uniref:hypothetical protein n=1 Tax=Nocardia sp. NPDC057227 TaxID=3346056 RepID=UPI003629432C
MTGFRAAAWGAALGILLALTIACSSPEPVPVPAAPASAAPAQHTVADLCAALLAYFRGDLGVVDLQPAPEHDLSTPLRIAGRCVVAAGSERVGSISITPAPNADRTEVETPLYQRLEGVSGRGWVSDVRPYGPLTFLLYDNESRVSLFVYESAARTATGPLALTDDQVRRTAEFGFEVARTLASG